MQALFIGGVADGEEIFIEEPIDVIVAEMTLRLNGKIESILFEYRLVRQDEEHAIYWCDPEEPDDVLIDLAIKRLALFPEMEQIIED